MLGAEDWKEREAVIKGRERAAKRRKIKERKNVLGKKERKRHP